jgi:hypothetical protein
VIAYGLHIGTRVEMSTLGRDEQRAVFSEPVKLCVLSRLEQRHL